MAETTRKVVSEFQPLTPAQIPEWFKPLLAATWRGRADELRRARRDPADADARRLDERAAEIDPQPLEEGLAHG